MSASAETLKLTARVIGFDIMEILIQRNEKLESVFLHAGKEISNENPNLVTGHRVPFTRCGDFLQKLCDEVRQSRSNIVWRSVEDFESTRERKDVIEVLYNVPIKTVVAFRLTEFQYSSDVYICGFSEKCLPYNSSSVKYLSGVGYAIGVAVFDLDEHDDNFIVDVELDTKEFLPRVCTPFGSAINLAAIASPQADVRIWARQVSGMKLPTSSSSNLVSLDKTNSTSAVNLDEFVQSKGFQALMAKESESVDRDDGYGYFDVPDISSPRGPDEALHSSVHSEEIDKTKKINTIGMNNNNILLNREITDSFSFPMKKVPILSTCPEDLQFENFINVRHIGEGSNSNIFTATYQNEMVVIKMIMDEATTDPIASLEFDVEYAVLCRLNHPNIIRVLGSGILPRKFIVLEWLGGGTLNSTLSTQKKSTGLRETLFHRPAYSFLGMLAKARDLATALDYLHSHVYPGLTIIHRDLKPDNIGFTKDGKLKLFDFGLCACVNRRSDSDEAYDMSGNTGSLRFMAPEVALRHKYSEKADVYSFAIVIWQTAKDQVPYNKMSKIDFIEKVVLKGERPVLEKSWPKAFSSMLTSCWDNDPKKRPSFEEVIITIDSLLASSNRQLWTRRSNNTNTSNVRGEVIKTESSRSSWF
eukprot:gene2408-4677_t